MVNEWIWDVKWRWQNISCSVVDSGFTLPKENLTGICVFPQFLSSRTAGTLRLRGRNYQPPDGNSRHLTVTGTQRWARSALLAVMSAWRGGTAGMFRWLQPWTQERFVSECLTLSSVCMNCPVLLFWNHFKWTKLRIKNKKMMRPFFYCTENTDIIKSFSNTFIQV